ncbi:hypothetical protein Jiend_20590 [Micromonospora endophytica]|nr:hypothetical protein Jiend_20590 [Micromonospora endophytica]
MTLAHPVRLPRAGDGVARTAEETLESQNAPAVEAHGRGVYRVDGGAWNRLSRPNPGSNQRPVSTGPSPGAETILRRVRRPGSDAS